MDEDASVMMMLLFWGGGVVGVVVGVVGALNERRNMVT